MIPAPLSHLAETTIAMAGYELPEPTEGNPAARPTEPPVKRPGLPKSRSESPTGSPSSMPGFELQSQTVRPCDPAFLHGVVVGFDGSVSSERALAYAVGMARRSRVGLVIVHVANRLPATVWAGCEPPVFVDVPDHRTEVLGLELACSDFLGDVPWVLVERGGDICHELEEVAREYAADAIVVGGTHGFLGRLFGSVAGRLARRANRPVVVIP
jgi:nucleotide-binding universal stress UspA family protein